MFHVELRNVSKRFGAFEAIKDLNLTIKEGSFTALLGPSGCGKSTLLRLIAGLEPVTSGQIFINGQDVTNVPPAKRQIAMVFQSYALYPHMSVRENIAFSLDVAGKSKTEQQAKADEVAELLQLDQLMDRKPAHLSGGQRQRVAIGRALVRNPEVFLFDEPLSNLDAMLRVQMRMELASLHQKLKTTMIYVTHDQIEAMTLADQIVVLDGGEISQVGAPLDLYKQPENKFVASFIGSPAMNFLAADVRSVEGKSVTLGLAENRQFSTQVRGEMIKSASQLEIGIRPEDISLSAADHADAEARGSVKLVERLGNSTLVHIASENGDLTAQVAGDLDVKTGEQVGLLFDAQKTHLFDQNRQVI